MDEHDIQRLYELVADESDDAALDLIRELRAQGHTAPELDFYEGLAIYGKKNDLECLRLLTTFAKQNPTHIKRNYAVFTCAICLINLELQAQALHILNSLPESYPDRNKEIEACKKQMEKQKKALVYAETLLPK